MAAKKKRSRGLGGSTEHHQQMTKYATEDAKTYYSKAGLEAQRGQCDAAFGLLRAGDSMAARAAAHFEEVSSNRESYPADRELQSATKYFRKHCVISPVGAKLSGMKRRSRR